MAADWTGPDYTADHKEAIKLLWKIKRYWMSRGVKVNIEIVPEYVGSLRIYPIRSDLRLVV